MIAHTDTSKTLEKELRTHTRGEVLFTAGDRARYATDASIYQETPIGVFVPQTGADVEAALGVARGLGVPLVPRGGGTSQCGQTVGAGLVIDHSKYLRHITNLDVENRLVTVQPGMVLDHLNAQLKPHGLWYPVDVSTSAQATLGGMAGNNSCGSRSIKYGNMVHNVAGLQMLTATGESLALGRFDAATGRERALGEFVQKLALGLVPEIEANVPRVLRRVGGYNLDVFHPMSERPYTTDGSVNLAHLLIGSEGTLGLTQSLTLRLSELPKAKVLGVVNFESFYKAMDTAQHIVKLGSDGFLTAVELVDRTMLDLALANPAFAPTIRTALANPSAATPAAVLLVEFAGASKAELLPKMRQLVELMGDLGIPNSVVEMTDDAAQKNLWEVRKAGLNIMMSLKGDGKPVSFIEDCAVPLESLAEYTQALTDVFAKYGSRGTWYAHASVGTLHVRPILDMRRDGGLKMRAMAEEASALVRKFKGAYSGEHGDGLCRGEWIEWQFGSRINDAFKAIKQHLDPTNLLCPGRMVATDGHPIPKMEEPSLLRFAPDQTPFSLALEATGSETTPLSLRDISPTTAGANKVQQGQTNTNHADLVLPYAIGGMSRSDRGVAPYKVIPLKPALNWSAWNVQADPVTEITTAAGTGGDPAQGLAKMVEMCNNNGHCRKFDAGTMCPSYRVTRDEQHVTRGRANTLRMAMSGQLDDVSTTPQALSDVALHAAHDALDLCVSCKGCKRDCPTGVDMAKVKIEFTQVYKQRFGHTLKDKLIGYMPDYARLASQFASVLNLRNRVPLLAWVGEKWLGFSAKRSLPTWQSKHFFNSPIKTATKVEVLTAAKPVVLFVDTFNGYFESANAHAAVKVLQAAGYTVHVASKQGEGAQAAYDDGHLCCGRTYLSTGMVSKAVAKMTELLTALAPFADKGIKIVGLEPSCLLTLRDEALVMTMDAGLQAIAQNVANHALLFEEFLADEARAGRMDALKAVLQATPHKTSQPILLHGHCHQKAFDAVTPILEVLGWLPRAEGVAKPALIESSCCGMAGSFGYEANHLDVSMQMAELSLLPAIHKQADAIVVADGTSCRHQILDGTALDGKTPREAIHVALLLAQFC
jgi:FAD/FMN-containing dehydrogenase/Fe-S oxidoreductase